MIKLLYIIKRLILLNFVLLFCARNKFWQHLILFLRDIYNISTHIKESRVRKHWCINLKASPTIAAIDTIIYTSQPIITAFYTRFIPIWYLYTTLTSRNTIGASPRARSQIRHIADSRTTTRKVSPKSSSAATRATIATVRAVCRNIFICTRGVRA